MTLKYVRIHALLAVLLISFLQTLRKIALAFGPLEEFGPYVQNKDGL